MKFLLARESYANHTWELIYPEHQPFTNAVKDEDGRWVVEFTDLEAFIHWMRHNAERSTFRYWNDSSIPVIIY